jgi:DNA-binding HxlR family transcriptional regulator
MHDNMKNDQSKVENPCEHDKTECNKTLTPIREALSILTGKWKIPIIVSLSFGNKRFKEMEREISGITGKMLSKELRDMESNELVKRTVYDSVPVSVEYSLTAYGKSLKSVIEELRCWGIKHMGRSKSKNPG